MIVSVTFKFDAAHSLPVPQYHPCHNLHGHSWTVRLWLKGPVVEPGWVVDYWQIRNSFSSILDRLDHHFLNDIEEIGATTCENLAIWIWGEFQRLMHLDIVRKSTDPFKDVILIKILVSEADGNACEYEGN